MNNKFIILINIIVFYIVLIICCFISLTIVDIISANKEIKEFSLLSNTQEKTEESLKLQNIKRFIIILCSFISIIFLIILPIMVKKSFKKDITKNIIKNKK